METWQTSLSFLCEMSGMENNISSGDESCFLYFLYTGGKIFYQQGCHFVWSYSITQIMGTFRWNTSPKTNNRVSVSFFGQLFQMGVQCPPSQTLVLHSSSPFSFSSGPFLVMAHQGAPFKKGPSMNSTI